MYGKNAATFLFLVGILGLSMPTQAAPPSGTVLPGQIEKQFQTQPQLRQRSEGIERPQELERVPPGAAEIRFSLNAIELEGFSAYPQGELETYLGPLLNREVTLLELYRLANTLTTKYRSDGYILSQVVVPAQSIEKGVARLQAIEGYISQVRIVGDRYDSRDMVADYAERIRRERPLTADALEHYMLLINDLPGMFARATLSASKSEFGAADLTIHFERDTVSGGVALDNRGGEELGPLRVVADLQLNNLLSLFERTALMVAQAEGQEMQYASISHEQQLGREGTKIKIDYSALRAEPENLSFIPLEQEVESDSANLIVSHPMIRSRKQNLYLRTGLTMHNGTTRLFGAKMIDEQLRVARLGLTYDRIDSSGATNLIDVEVSQGLNGLGSSENGDLLLSRADGRVDFSKLTLYLARLQPFSSHWSLLAAANGQYAFDR